MVIIVIDDLLMHSGILGYHWLLMLQVRVFCPIILYPGLQLYITVALCLCGGREPSIYSAFGITGSLHSTPESKNGKCYTTYTTVQ